MPGNKLASPIFVSAFNKNIENDTILGSKISRIDTWHIYLLKINSYVYAFVIFILILALVQKTIVKDILF